MHHLRLFTQLLGPADVLAMFSSGAAAELRLLEIQALNATGLWSDRSFLDALHTTVDEMGIMMRLRLV